LEKKIKNDENKDWKFILNNFHRNTGNASYRPADSNYKIREIINYLAKSATLNYFFGIAKQYTIEYNDYNYIHQKEIQNVLSSLNRILFKNVNIKNIDI